MKLDVDRFCCKKIFKSVSWIMALGREGYLLLGSKGGYFQGPKGVGFEAYPVDVWGAYKKKKEKE